MWDVASLFRLAVAFTIGVAGAGGDHAGAGAFLDDVVDHCRCFPLSLLRTLPLFFEGFLYAFDCITVGVVSAIGGDICVVVLYVAPRLACCLSVGRECEGVFWWLILFWLILR